MTLTRRLQLLALAVVGLAIVAILIEDAHASWRELLVPALFAAASALAVATLVARTITQPIEELRDVTRSLATGSLSSRPPISSRGEIGELATAIHRLAEHLSGRMSALESEDALLTALIESLNEGVAAIDSEQRVFRINQAGRDLLRVSDRTPFAVDRLPRVPELRRAIQGAIDGKITEPVELTIGDHTVSLSARPLSRGGAVLALFDLTRIRQLELVRRDFVANVSHELRTPLTVIGGFAETLADEDLPEDNRRQFASTIRAHTQRMQRIVDDLLDLSRIESGGWIPKPTSVDLDALARELVDATQSAAAEKNIVIEAAISPSANRAYADGTALRQILSNLVENGLRHTATGSVRIFSEPDTDGVWVGVSDTGEGIRPDHLPRIFERFYRADAGRAREQGGTGLGLAIVRHMTEAHGGRVQAESDLGIGTTIKAYFPSA